MALNGGLASSGTVRIGDSLLGAITLPSNGLAGQVLVNADNMTMPGTWTTGTVTVGGTTLAPAPYYANTAASIGGGAVGLAAFGLHEQSCVPPNNPTPSLTEGVLFSAFTPGATPVRPTWYGPVQLPAGVSDPMEILMVEVQDPRPGHACDDWIDLTSIFSFSMHPGGQARTLGIGATVLPRAGVYRVRYNAEGLFLRCNGVLGNPPPAVTFAVDGCDSGLSSYTFRILPDCDANGVNDYVQIAANPSLDYDQDGVLDSCEGDPCQCDWDKSGSVSVQDIFSFLEDWFGGDADFNQSGSTTTQDIFDFLGCWFASMGQPCD